MGACGAGRIDVGGADRADDDDGISGRVDGRFDVCGDGRVACGDAMRVVEVAPDVVDDCRVDWRSGDSSRVAAGLPADARDWEALPPELRVEVEGAELRVDDDPAAVIRDVLARGAPAAWFSTVDVRVIRAALARPSAETISGRPPRRGLGTQTLS